MKLPSRQRGLAAVIFSTILCGGILFFNRIIAGDVFGKEEAQHALYGLWLYKDLLSLDWAGFWYDTGRQMFWPFLHSWVLAVNFLIFGASYVSARLLSLLIFIATLFMMYGVSCKFSEKLGSKIGLMSVMLALTSPIMLRFATENTLEGLGAFIFIASFYFYAVCEERKLVYEYAILGVLIGLSIYTNYLYAYLMIPAYIIATLVKIAPMMVEGVHLTAEGEKAALPFIWWAYKKLIVLLVLLSFIAVWFLSASFSRKIMLFLQAIFRYSGGEAAVGWGGLFYYPKIIILDYCFSPWIGLLILAAVFKPFVASQYRQVKKMYVFIWTVLVLATLTVPTKAPQFIYLIAPFLFMVFSAMVFYWAEKLKEYKGIIFAVIFIPALISLPSLWGSYFPSHPPENMKDVLGFFRQQIPMDRSIAASFNLQRLNPEVIAFHFWDWRAPVISDPVVGQEEMFGRGQALLAVEIAENSPHEAENIDDSSRVWNTFLADRQKSGEIREIASRSFGGLGVTAKIYEKTAK